MKQKFYSLHGTAVDKDGEEHIVTIVGELLQEKCIEPISESLGKLAKKGLIDMENGGYADDAILTVNVPFKTRTLTYAFSICHPDDIYDEEIGVELAKRRIKESPLGQMTTSMITTLCPDQIKLILFGELKYVIDNIDKFI